MSFDQALAFFLFALVAAATPGPSNVLLTATGANVGLRRGLPCLLGVTLGMGFMMAVVAFGLGSLVLENPEIRNLLKWCGAAFLLWLSWKIASARPAASSTDAADPGDARPVGFFGAAAFQWVNPKSWLVCAGAAGTYLQAESAGAAIQALSLGGVFVAAALPGTFLWLAAGAALQQFLRDARKARAFNIVMGAILAGSIILFITAP